MYTTVQVNYSSGIITIINNNKNNNNKEMLLFSKGALHWSKKKVKTITLPKIFYFK